MKSIHITTKAGGIVVQKQTGKLALVVNQFGATVLPKGSVEAGESLARAAEREIAEETGITALENAGILGIIERPGHSSAVVAEPDVVKQIHLFLFVTDEEVLRPAKEDSLSALWLDPASAVSQLSWAEEAQFVQLHLGSISGAAK
jgi:8-oxo-dGTP pyrophosphatase MutT (NUDIX family)